MTSRVATANRLADGEVVFLAPDASWSVNISDARIAESEVEAKALESVAQAAGADHLVIEPYLIDVKLTITGVRALKYREHLRTLGPTVRLDLGKQAMGNRFEHSAVRPK